MAHYCFGTTVLIARCAIHKALSLYCPICNWPRDKVSFPSTWPWRCTQGNTLYCHDEAGSARICGLATASRLITAPFMDKGRSGLIDNCVQQELDWCWPPEDLLDNPALPTAWIGCAGGNAQKSASPCGVHGLHDVIHAGRIEQGGFFCQNSRRETTTSCPVSTY